MRCSSRFCIGFLIAGIGGAALLAAYGYVEAATLLSLLPILACPLMCVAMMVLHKYGDDGECRPTHGKKAAPARTL